MSYARIGERFGVDEATFRTLLLKDQTDERGQSNS